MRKRIKSIILGSWEDDVRNVNDKELGIIGLRRLRMGKIMLDPIIRKP